jgi:small redox-active disulfide protein 2
MKTIKILGTGCPNCKRTETIIRKVVEELKLNIKIEKVEDIQDIIAYDVMSTPAIVLDEKVVIKGRVPNAGEIKNLLNNNCCNEDDDSCCGGHTKQVGLDSCC